MPRPSQIHEERDKLYERYQSMLHELQQKAVFKNVLLSKKMEVLTGQLEKKVRHFGAPHPPGGCGVRLCAVPHEQCHWSYLA